MIPRTPKQEAHLVSSREAVEAIIESSKGERSLSWEQSLKRTSRRIPRWDDVRKAKREVPNRRSPPAKAG
jgi:hypothetical protein